MLDFLFESLYNEVKNRTKGERCHEMDDRV